MTTEDVSEKLLTLGYTKPWLDYGVLTFDNLNKQYEAFQNGEDSNTEHYRYGTFRYYLATKESLADEELDNYLRLVLADDDYMMAGAAAQDLFTAVRLTAEQFEKVCREIDKFDGVWTTRIITRQRLIRRIKSQGLTDVLFEECLREGDRIVQEFVLDRANAQQLQKLAAEGITRKVRNSARQKLRAASQ